MTAQPRVITETPIITELRRAMPGIIVESTVLPSTREVIVELSCKLGEVTRYDQFYLDQNAREAISAQARRLRRQALDLVADEVARLRREDQAEIELLRREVKTQTDLVATLQRAVDGLTR